LFALRAFLKILFPLTYFTVALQCEIKEPQRIFLQGLFCKDFYVYGMDNYLNLIDQKVIQAGNVLESDYHSFNKELTSI